MPLPASADNSHVSVGSGGCCRRPKRLLSTDRGACRRRHGHRGPVRTGGRTVESQVLCQVFSARRSRDKIRATVPGVACASNGLFHFRHPRSCADAIDALCLLDRTYTVEWTDYSTGRFQIDLYHCGSVCIEVRILFGCSPLCTPSTRSIYDSTTEEYCQIDVDFVRISPTILFWGGG